ncbi:MAG: Amidase [Candidatus Tokpelaia hoelldobleri]|uniref:N-acetylmuramoyl-L-alanine amidase n=1 Tax=Candidatus Tokpelaia hoelldobleri TaxID=1902579 RepID=A0A1U9JUW1_9HYPH|nr:MAG: Amidase [Candidatus Tokpelaia hoelldoblerii]
MKGQMMHPEKQPLLFVVLHSFFKLFLLIGCVSCLNTGVALAQTGTEKPLLEVLSLRIVGDMQRTRLVAAFSQKADYQMLLLADPARLVLSLPVAVFPDPARLQQKSAFVADMRHGLDGSGRSRVILTMKSFFQVENHRIEQLPDYSWQLIVDLVAASEAEFRGAVTAQYQARLAKQGDSQMPQGRKPFVVAVDAGHGAFDGGAVGVNGTFEKDITLAFALTLADELRKKPQLEVYLTRNTDVFLRLNERVARARAAGADLFISIHADHIDSAPLRGATVYTLSDKASDAISKKLADSENKVDLLDGMPADELPEVADILIDLTRRETQAFSIDFADRVIQTFTGNNISLIRNPHRYAAFQVLRAPDMPSVLIELGYLSNAEDEKLITSAKWRQKTAGLIANSVENYAQAHR